VAETSKIKEITSMETKKQRQAKDDNTVLKCNDYKLCTIDFQTKPAWRNHTRTETETEREKAEEKSQSVIKNGEGRQLRG
jgi:hypothetical protein